MIYSYQRYAHVCTYSEIQCPEVSLLNSNITPSNGVYGVKLVVVCDPGYRLSDGDIVQHTECASSGTWGSLEECQREWNRIQGAMGSDVVCNTLFLLLLSYTQSIINS